MVGAVVSKPMPANTTWRLGSAAAMRTASRGEYDHAHVGAVGARRGERAARRRHADEIAEGHERHLGEASERDHAVEVGHRRDAHRAARPADQSQTLGQQLAQAVAGDRHGVRAADLHEGQAGGRLRAQLGGEPAEVVSGRHRRPGGRLPGRLVAGSPSSNAPISRRRS